MSRRTCTPRRADPRASDALRLIAPGHGRQLRRQRLQLAHAPRLAGSELAHGVAQPGRLLVPALRVAWMVQDVPPSSSIVPPSSSTVPRLRLQGEAGPLGAQPLPWVLGPLYHSSWLEHPRPWLGAKCAGLSPGSVEPARAAEARPEEAQEPSWGAAELGRCRGESWALGPLRACCVAPPRLDQAP